MTAGAISPDSSLELVLDHTVYTAVRLAVHPLTTAVAKPFEQLLEQWWDVDKQETLLWIGILRIMAKVVAADDTLDDLVDAIHQNLLLVTKGQTNDPRYTQYFTRPPSALKRPILREQVTTVRTWVPSLKASEVDALLALGAQLEAAVKAADEAMVELGAAQQNNREFRLSGARRGYIDQVNAARKAAYGTLSELPYQKGNERLPKKFAERFFKRVKAKAEAAASAEQLVARITAMEQELQALKVEHAEAVAKQERGARQEREKGLEALAEAEREAADAAARAAALKARLGL